MEKFLLTWLIISFVCGIFLQVKVDGEYIKGFKRFIIAFIVGFPFALIMGLFAGLLIPLLIIIAIVFILVIIVRVLE